MIKQLLRRLLPIGLATAGVIASVLPGTAKEVTLKLATLSPPNADIVTRALQPWADRVNKMGKGIVHIDVVNGSALANFGNAYERVLSDVVQISWGIPTFIGGKFQRTGVTTLPFQSDADSETKATALYRLYENGPLKEEYDEVIPLAFSTFPAFGFHFAKKPSSMMNLNGMTINVTGSVPAKLVAAMGGAATSLALQENYEALERGTIDATALSWTSFPQFKLAEVTKYHVEGPFGNNNAMIFMSRAKFNSLPAAAQKIIMETSGEALSAAFGKFWDKLWAQARASVKARPGQTIRSLTPKEMAVWEAKAKPIIANWEKSTPDGQEVLDQYLKVIADIKHK